jgi:hypothetical protein
MTEADKICLVRINVRRLFRKTPGMSRNLAGMAPQLCYGWRASIVRHKVCRHCIDASLNSQICYAIFHSDRPALGTPILAPRQPQDLQRRSKVTQNKLRHDPQIDTEPLRLKLYQQQRLLHYGYIKSFAGGITTAGLNTQN